jgi:endoglucanase
MKRKQLNLGLIIAFGAIICCVILFLYFQKSQVFSSFFGKSQPRAYGEASTMRGINLGNAFEAPNPGDWGVTIRPEYFEIIRKAGFNTVRLPVRISAHTQTKPPYSIDASFLAKIDELINAGIDKELTIILDIHHYADLMSDPNREQERFLAIWEQIGEHYKMYPKYLYFELINEPSDKLDSATWNELLLKGIQVVRKKNPQRKVLIDTTNFSNIETLQTLRLPEDENLIATFHFYEPFHFTHQGADWVEGADQWRGTVWLGTEAEQKYITSQFDLAAAWSMKHTIPIVMGEFGAIVLADKASRIRWTAFTAAEAEKRNIGWIHWQFCSDFPLYSCKEDRWEADMLGALIPEK